MKNLNTTLSLETLESRVVPTASITLTTEPISVTGPLGLPQTQRQPVLIVQGTDGNDRIVVQQSKGLSGGTAIQVSVFNRDTNALLASRMFTNVNGSGWNPLGSSSQKSVIAWDSTTLVLKVDARNGSDEVINNTALRSSVFLGHGNDTYRGGSGRDFVNGGDGNDTIYGGAGNDYLMGDAGNDFLFGQDGEDVLEGGNDNDHLFGGRGADELFGGQGNDYLDGGHYEEGIANRHVHTTMSGALGSADLLVGGDGYDTFLLNWQRRGDAGFRVPLASVARDLNESIDTVMFGFRTENLNDTSNS